MKIEIDTAGVHLGNWIAPAELWDLIEPMAHRWHNRLSGLYCGDWEDLAQAGRVALLLYLREKGEVDRVRELEALSVLDKAFYNELKTLRTGLWGRKRIKLNLLLVPEQSNQPNEDQRYLLDRFLMNAAKASRRPNWEMLWLRKVMDWSAAEIAAYFRKKKDDRQGFTEAQVEKRVEVAEKRIKKHLKADLLQELARYSWTSEWQ